MKRFSGSVDLISDLPSQIIENILIRMPICDAMRTSILSRKWRYKWTTLPQLVFGDLLSQKTMEDGPLAKEKLVAAVYHVLLLHKGPIVKFTFTFPQLDICSYVDQWIHFLSDHDIQEFSLSFPSGCPYKLPSYFFYFLHSRHLKLQLCSFKPPPTFRGFSRLVSLDLKGTDFDPELFESFISNCPLLEELTLSGGSCFGHLEIIAPNLKIFTFNGVLEAICFKNTPVLAVVSIDLSSIMRPFRQECFNLFEIGHSLPALEKLSLGYHFLELLTVHTTPRVHPNPLNHLKTLILSLRPDYQVLNALDLIKNSPSLQKLVIVITRFGGLAIGHAMMKSVEYLVGQDDFSHCLKHLQEVKLQFISGVAAELELIRLVLANSPALQKMEIVANKLLLSYETEINILRKLIQFPRASSRAEVKYSDSEDFTETSSLI